MPTNKATTPNTNRRMAALENAAEKTARILVAEADPTIKVVVGPRAAYEWKAKRLTVPCYSTKAKDPRLENAWRGLLDHECGHVVFTDFKTTEDRIAKWTAEFGTDKAGRIFSFANGFEDLRIEREFSAHYRGAVFHLDTKNEYLIEETGGAKPCDPAHRAEPGAPPLGIVGALGQVIVRVGRGRVAVEELPPEMQALVTANMDILKAGWAARTTEEVLDAAEQLWRRLEEQSKPPPSPPPPPEKSEEGSEEEEGEEGEGDDSEGEDDSEGGEGEEGDDSEKSEGEEEGDGSDSAEGEDDSEGKGDSEGEGSEEEGEGSEGDGSDDSEEEEGDGESKGSEKGDSESEGEEEGEGSEGSEGDGSSEGGEESEEGGTEESPSGSGDDTGAAPEEGSEESEPSGDSAGGGGKNGVQSSAAQAIGGEWAAFKSDADVIASKYVAEMPPQYTVCPESAAKDRVVTFGPAQRKTGRDVLPSLESAAGPAAAKLMGLLKGAVAAARQSLIIGGAEEGEDIDENALPVIALRQREPGIFTQTMTRITESTFVCVLVDCSGSMGSSSTENYCPEHGEGVYGRHDCPVCGKPYRSRVRSKSGYAAITAMCLHKALTGVRIPHAVLGYTTDDGVPAYNPTDPKTGYRKWSRAQRSLLTLEFVPAPGVHDDGSALPYINGISHNLDGESVLFAAKYAAKNGGQYDRVILIVVADGLPAGADDNRIEGPYLKQVVEQVAAAGIEVYGVGVCLSAGSSWGGGWETFKQYYPDVKARPGRAPTGALEIKAGEGLTDGVLRQLTSLLTRGWGMSRRGKR